MSKSTQIKIVEVGMRDGLQNEKINLSVYQRLELFKFLFDSGIKNIELGSFVSPKWVPQMAGTEDLLKKIDQKYNLNVGQFEGSVLVPNEIGLSSALKSKVPEIAVFISSSEAFSKANINCSIAESLERARKVIIAARKHKIKVRGYLSVCFGCPYEGVVPEAQVVRLARELIKMGCYEVSIGDTIGIAQPLQVERLFKKLKKVIPIKKLAGHFHDTRGLALTNIFAAFKLGIKIFDSSIGGLGGCPYAKGATGNVATEDVVYMFHQMGYMTGVDLRYLIEATAWLETVMKRSMSSRISKILK